MDFDSSHVLPVGDVTVDASLKDYSLPVIDQAPESLSEEETPNEKVATLEETDSLGAIKNFPQTVRVTQPFSPSSGSDVDTSVVESEADTLAAVTPNNPATEVDVDLITKFERLVLCKQLPYENSPATPTLNTTFPLNDETTPINQVQVNNTTSSVIEAEDDDIIPADATRDVLSETQDVPSANPDESEVTSPFEQEECSFALLKATHQTQNRQTVLQQSSLIVGDLEPSIVEKEAIPVAHEGSALTDEEQAASCVDRENDSVVDERISASEEESALVVEEHLVPVAEGETVLIDEKLTAFNEGETVPLVEEQPIAVEEQSVLVVDNQKDPVAEDQAAPVIEENLTVTVEVIPEPAEVATSEVDQTRAEDDSTFLSAAEQTVLNAGDKSYGTTDASETPTEETQASSTVTEETQATSTVTQEISPISSVTTQEVETTIVKPTSLPEEKPIVPKKGYDLSFLDRFDNLENATPSFSQAKLPLPSLSIGDSSAEGIQSFTLPCPYYPKFEFLASGWNLDLLLGMQTQGSKPLAFCFTILHTQGRWWCGRDRLICKWFPLGNNVLISLRTIAFLVLIGCLVFFTVIEPKPETDPATPHYGQLVETNEVLVATLTNVETDADKQDSVPVTSQGNLFQRIYGIRNFNILSI